MWYSLTNAYEVAVFKALFPTGKTQRGERIHLDLSRDSRGYSLDTAMYNKFKSVRDPILALVRPKLSPGVRDVPRADDNRVYYDSSGDDDEQE
jgi:hypothetical protein